jgi:NADH-quinone oxidoreductase subunit A
MNPYVVFLLYLIAILGFVAVMLLANKLLGPKPAMTAMKQEPFECGATVLDTRDMHSVPVKYYAVAIVFILFDLETVFLFIWALGAQPLTGVAYEKYRALFGADIAVYATHLPLDGHAELGNNVRLAHALDLAPSGGFARYKTFDVGVTGEGQLPTAELVARVEAMVGRLKAMEHGS